MSKSVDADEARRQPEKPIPIGEQLKGSPNVLRFIREILPNLKTLPVGPISHLVPPEEIWRFHRATMADERLRREPDYQKDWLDQLRELPATIIDIKSRFLTRQERVRIRGDSQYCSDAQQAAFELGLDYERPKTKLTLEDELNYLIGLDQQFRRHQAQLVTNSQSPLPPDPSIGAKPDDVEVAIVAQLAVKAADDETVFSSYYTPQKWRPRFVAAGHAMSARTWTAFAKLLRERTPPHLRNHRQSGPKAVAIALSVLQEMRVEPPG